MRDKLNKAESLAIHDALRADEQLHYYIECTETHEHNASRELLNHIYGMSIRQEVLYLYNPIATYLTPLDYTLPGKTLEIEALSADLEPLGYKFIYTYK